MTRALQGLSRTLALVALALAGCDPSGDDAYRDKLANGPQDGDVDDGCTLTQGYWKTHDDWPDHADAELCGHAWADILWMAPVGGDAWIIVAHQYIAAKLNVANGAVAEDAITQALADAEALLADCAIADADREAAIALATLLDDFNNGLVGPGHCDDGGTEGGEGEDEGGATEGGEDDAGEGVEGGEDDGYDAEGGEGNPPIP